VRKAELDSVREVGAALEKELSRAVVGYAEAKRMLLVSLLAGGHVLLEGVPGVAKTTSVKALARLLGLTEAFSASLNGVPHRGFSRVQFTPDLMPSDVLGSLVFNPATRDFEVRFGPVFTYFLLADEINRAVPRTQSALLEAMQERQVTIGGRTYPLEIRSAGKFFFVAATQNPVEQEGTYPLPEAQLDRFLSRIIVEYPASIEEEKSIYELHMGRLSEPLEDLEKVAEPSWVVSAQEAVATGVEVPDEVLAYVAKLVRATRPSVFPPIAEYFELGASPRAGIALVRAAKAHAALRGSAVVEEIDVRPVLFPVLNHRVIPSLERVVEVESAQGRFAARYKVIREGLSLAERVASQ
jgi:MoxR-like ATPase